MPNFPTTADEFLDDHFAIVAASDIPDPEDFEGCEEATPDDLVGVVEGDTLPHPDQLSAVDWHVFWLPDVLRSAGLHVQVVDDWKVNGRDPVHGPFGPLRGTLSHHTGATSSATRPAPSLGVLRRGRSDLPGPLAQWTVGFDGVATVLSAGRANHAGRAKACGAIPPGDGNLEYIGCEVDTNGTQSMPPAQRDAWLHGTAAIHKHMGWDARRAWRHADSSVEGKWDLGGIHTNWLQAQVAHLLATPPKPQAEYVVVTKWPDDTATLWGIAKKYHTTVARLMTLNPQIKKADDLSIGQKVRVR